MTPALPAPEASTVRCSIAKETVSAWGKSTHHFNLSVVQEVNDITVADEGGAGPDNNH